MKAAKVGITHVTKRCEMSTFALLVYDAVHFS